VSVVTLIQGLPEAQRLGRVAVVMGGWSPERDVSLMSGEPVFDALVKIGVDAQAVDAGRDIAQVLLRDGFDRAFLILHGGAGEDGTVQAALELAGIPYTGSGVLGSALSMDKVRAKALCREAGVPTPDSGVCDDLAAARQAAASLGYPLVVKPVAGGSSIGVTIVHESAALDAAWRLAADHGAVLLERFAEGIELTATVLRTPEGTIALPLVSMRAASGFYDYDAKYLLDDTQYDCPAPIDAALTARVQALALRAFAALDARGWGRIDFMLDARGEPQFIECNTAPGMTSHSLVPMAAAQAGLSFERLCLSILSDTLHDESEPGRAPRGQAAPSLSAGACS